MLSNLVNICTRNLLYLKLTGTIRKLHPFFKRAYLNQYHIFIMDMYYALHSSLLGRTIVPVMLVFFFSFLLFFLSIRHVWWYFFWLFLIFMTARILEFRCTGICTWFSRKKKILKSDENYITLGINGGKGWRILSIAGKQELKFIP